MPAKKKKEDNLPLEVRAAMKALNKQFGANSVLSMSDSPDCTDVKNLIPTGSLKLDKAIGTLRKSPDDKYEHGVPSGRVVEVYGPEAAGKCHAPGTPILMFDGAQKNVEDVQIGDLVMGPDSKPREVLQTVTGEGELFKISPISGFTDPFIVNGDHILVLKNKERQINAIKEVSVYDYIEKSKNYKIYHRLMRAPVSFNENQEDLPIDPYFLGLWLGDGTSESSDITSADEEIGRFLEDYAKELGHEFRKKQYKDKCPSYVIVDPNNYQCGGRPLRSILKEIGVLNNKHIPHCYKTASIESRRRLFAGIIDSDGYASGQNIDLCLKSKQLITDVMFVARSLGFKSRLSKRIGRIKSIGFEGEYWRTSIGGDYSEIPIRLDRRIPKERTASDYSIGGFKVKQVNNGVFYGFTLDGDHRYLTGDFVIHHNTTVCNQIIAQSQRQKGLCAFIDMEQSWNKVYAESLGVNTEDLVISQPDCGEEALEIANTLLKTGKFSVIVVDSVAALVPRSELEGEIGKASMGVMARMMSQSLRMMGATIRKTATTVIFTNQLRSKIGVVFGNPEITSGGNALKFYASLRLDCRRVGDIKNQDGEVIGHTQKVKVVKNKLAQPFRVAEFDLYYGRGADKVGEIIDMAVEYGLMQKGGAWYTIGEEKFQGINAVRSYLSENNLIKEYYEKVMEAMYNETR
jgi:recombination protein RecA